MIQQKYSNRSFGIESFTDQRIHQRFISFLDSEPKGTLLDIGAGTGALSKKLQKEGFEVTACDLNSDNFIPSDIVCKTANLNVAFPFSDNSFNYAVAAEVIEHLENPWFFIRELYRITKPGGTVIISTPNLHNWYVRLYFFFSSKLYNFLSSYEKIGHITPVFLWNLKRMCEGMFDVTDVTTSHSVIPKLEINIPLNGLFFGQCIVVKMKRKLEVEHTSTKAGGYHKK